MAQVKTTLTMKQVKLLTEEFYLKEKDSDNGFVLDDMSFEDYLNMEIGILHDEGHTVETIFPSVDMKRFLIVYKFRFPKTKTINK
jgi:hypothetical protein